MTGSKRAWWPGDRNTAIAGCDRAAADAVTSTAPAEAMTQVRNAYHLLTSQVAPHENAEDTQLYPAVNRLLGGEDPTAPMSRAHAEIAHQIARLGRLLDDIGDQDPDEADVAERWRRVAWSTQDDPDAHHRMLENADRLNASEDITAVPWDQVKAGLGL